MAMIWWICVAIAVTLVAAIVLVIRTNSTPDSEFGLLFTLYAFCFAWFFFWLGTMWQSWPSWKWWG